MSHQSSQPPISDLESSDELPQKERLRLALEAYKKDPKSMRKVAKQYGIPKSSLHDRVNGKMTKKEEQQRRQKLSPQEELAIVNWLLRLQAWGWPARIDHIRGMATELLKKKGDTQNLGIHWGQKFLGRHQQLKPAFIVQDKKRAMVEDRQIFDQWFTLYSNIKTEYSIDDANIWNMDEKGFMQGAIGKERVIISRHQLKTYMAQPGNREWVSAIECVSVDGKALKPWIVFKGKLQMKSWWDVLRNGHIALSENGWSDNAISFAWLRGVFHPETDAAQSNSDQWRMLLVDGHGSQVSTEALEFCIQQKIILLCLPHTKHWVQPLDIGVFDPLATTYKRLVQNKTPLEGAYSIDKVDFLELYQEARTQAIRPEAIVSAWESAGLSPYNLDLVLQRIPQPRTQTPPNQTPQDQIPQTKIYNLVIRHTVPEEATLSYFGPEGSYQVVLTPQTSTQLQQLLG